MSALILSAGRRFGRFAVALFVLPVIIIFYLWLSLLDLRPYWFLAAAFFVLPLLMAAVALLLGTLFAGLKKSSVAGVQRDDAPGLWSEWEGVAGSRKAASTVIVIDDRLNASIMVERALFGLAQDRIVLHVGLPLLAVTDEKAVISILAHEDAHHINKDTNGSLRLAELESTFEVMFEFAPPDSTLSGRFLYGALGWLAKPLEAERVRLSREAELAADRHSAAVGRALEMGRALILLAAADAYFDEQVHGPLRRELLGAMKPPEPPPMTRLMDAAPGLSDSALLNAYAGKAWRSADDAQFDHPSLGDRLSALGFSELPEIVPVASSAISTLLDRNFVARSIAEFNKTWSSGVAEALDR